MKILLYLFLTVFFITCSGRSIVRRQTYYYDPELKKYAQTHAGTVYQHGTLSLYGPEEWGKWYARNMMRWGGNSRFVPPH
uniref:Lipoprotein n=1 Tax=Parastrongyloides trichosuri TaxID=131310 RepID=A0A0N4ZZ97_PARTI